MDKLSGETFTPGHHPNMTSGVACRLCACSRARKDCEYAPQILPTNRPATLPLRPKDLHAPRKRDTNSCALMPYYRVALHKLHCPRAFADSEFSVPFQFNKQGKCPTHHTHKQTNRLGPAFIRHHSLHYSSFNSAGVALSIVTKQKFSLVFRIAHC